jgi:hypothetical protein
MDKSGSQTFCNALPPNRANPLGSRKQPCYSYVSLTLTVEEVAVNHALNKPAFQSSKYKEEGIPSRVVDGNRNGDFNGKSCTHTHSEQGAWWAVDLGAEYQVDRVAITNRADSSSKYKSFSYVGYQMKDRVTKCMY